MNIHFAKMTGAGNDFVLIDDRKNTLRSLPELARRLCDRRYGVGADGLLVIRRSRVASYTMLYFNADGTDGGMCGNGGRCIARYAATSSIAPRKHSFEALGYVYEAVVSRTSVALRMKNVRASASPDRLKLGGKEIEFRWFDTGAPHAVVHVPQRSVGRSVAEVDVASLGRALRFHRAFAPAGANINFFEKAGAGTIRMRTYERGVEAETLACGTGSIACALAAHEALGMKSPVKVITRSNEILRVSFTDRDDRREKVFLEGPAEIVFRGEADV